MIVHLVLELILKLAVLAAVAGTFNVLVETVKDVVPFLLTVCSAVESADKLTTGSLIPELLHEKFKIMTRMITVKKINLFILNLF